MYRSEWEAGTRKFSTFGVTLHGHLVWNAEPKVDEMEIKCEKQNHYPSLDVFENPAPQQMKQNLASSNFFFETPTKVWGSWTKSHQITYVTRNS